MSDLNRGEGLRNEAAFGGAFASGVLREAEVWTSAQCELLSGMGALWTQWARRQREAIDASSRSLQRMCECRSLADLVQIQQQWLADAAQRGAADLGTLASDAAALTSRVAAVTRPRPSGSAPARTGAPAKPGENAAMQRAAAE